MESSQMKIYFLVALLLISGGAIACTVLTALFTPVQEVSLGDSPGDPFREAADNLGDIYGDLHKDREIYTLRVPLMGCVFGFCSVSMSAVMVKPCDQTIEDRVLEHADFLDGQTDLNAAPIVASRPLVCESGSERLVCPSV